MSATATEMRTRRAASSRTLSDHQAGELDIALAGVRQRCIPLLGIARDDFALPSLGPWLRKLSSRLAGQGGFVVLRGGASVGSVREQRLVLWGIGQHLGTAVSQSSTGHLIRDLASSTAVDRYGRPLLVADQRFHTDAADLTVLATGRAGARIAVARAEDVVRTLRATRPDLATRLLRSYAFDLGVQGEGEQSFRMLPLVCETDGQLNLRYDRSAIEAAQASGLAPRLEPADVELFDTIEAIASCPSVATVVELGPEEIALLDNFAVLHAFLPQEANTVVHRLWVSAAQGRALPADFTWESVGQGGARVRGGVTPSDLIGGSNLGTTACRRAG